MTTCPPTNEGGSRRPRRREVPGNEALFLPALLQLPRHRHPALVPENLPLEVVARLDGPLGFRPSTARITSPPLSPSVDSFGTLITSTPSVVPKYWPRSGLMGASSRSINGPPMPNA